MRRTLIALIGLLGWMAQGTFALADERDALVRFRLAELAIVWTDTSRDLARILDPDGYVHLVTLGSGIGENAGEIIHIGEQRIVVLQLVSSGPRQWTTHSVTLARTPTSITGERLERSFRGGVFGFD